MIHITQRTYVKRDVEDIPVPERKIYICDNGNNTEKSVIDSVINGMRFVFAEDVNICTLVFIFGAMGGIFLNNTAIWIALKTVKFRQYIFDKFLGDFLPKNKNSVV